MTRHSAPMLCALAAALLASCTRETRPNVLVISIDTLRADHLGCYGYERPTSPNIDALAKQSVVFEDASSSAPWTLPSLSSLFTGFFSSTHGCDHLESRLDTTFTTLAEHLRNGGYDTAMVACHVFLTDSYGLQQGFTHVDEDLAKIPGELDRSISSPGVTERGLWFLRNQAAGIDDAPWMLWLHYFDPHADYLEHPGVSERFGTTEEIDLYDGEIAFTDAHVGMVLDELAKLGLDRETIVVLTSDHGEEFGEHGGSRHGAHVYQEVVHVPLIVRAPGVAPARVRAPVGNVDVTPTVLDLCRLPVPRPLDGVSLVPLLRGRSIEPRELLLEVRWRNGQNVRGVRREQWKYCEHRRFGAGPDLLFDLANDPREQEDLLEKDAPRTSAMRETLQRRTARAFALARPYPRVTHAEPLPGEMQHLRDIGYIGEESEDEAKATEPAKGSTAPVEAPK